MSYFYKESRSKERKGVAGVVAGVGVVEEVGGLEKTLFFLVFFGGGAGK